MFMPLMILRRLVNAGCALERKAERLDEVTVDAEPDAQLLVERLDVDVGRTVAHRLADDAADELDDRGLVVEADLGGDRCSLALIVADLEDLDESVDLVVGSIACDR